MVSELGTERAVDVGLELPAKIVQNAVRGVALGVDGPVSGEA